MMLTRVTLLALLCASLSCCAVLVQATASTDTNTIRYDEATDALLVGNVDVAAQASLLAQVTAEFAAYKLWTKSVLSRVGAPQWTAGNTACPAFDISSPDDLATHISSCITTAVTDPNDMYPLAFALVNNSALPLGLSLQENGSVTGSLAEAEVSSSPAKVLHTFTLRATNSANITTTEDCLFTILLWKGVVLAGEAGSLFGEFLSGISFDGSRFVLGANTAGTPSHGEAYEYAWGNNETYALSSLVGGGTIASTGDVYGYRVALSDDGLVCVVTAALREWLSVTNVGVAFVFARTNTSEDWTLAQELVSDEVDTSNNNFGDSGVYLSANASVLVIGQQRHDSTNLTNDGCVHVFHRNSSGLFERTQVLLAPTEMQSEELRFGHRLALSDDGMYMAASSTTGEDDRFMYHYDGVGEYTLLQWLSVPVCAMGNTHGGSSFSSGGELFAVARSECGTKGQGVVYVFAQLSPVFYILRQTIDGAQDSAYGDYFGSGVVLARDGASLIIGSRNHGTPSAGAVYVFQYSQEEEQFVEARKVVPQGAAEGDHWGRHMTLSGDGSTLLVHSLRDAVFVLKL